MRNRKYLKFYKQCMCTGHMPAARRKNVVVDGEKTTIFNGLCSLFPEVKLFTPTLEDCYEYNRTTSGYWAADDLTDLKLGTRFGPTRQTIVLFLAAMNGEL